MVQGVFDCFFFSVDHDRRRVSTNMESRENRENIGNFVLSLEIRGKLRDFFYLRKSQEKLRVQCVDFILLRHK